MDELFFEYHYWFDGHNFGWGEIDKRYNVDTALKLMTDLRNSAIRAHFWI